MKVKKSKNKNGQEFSGGEPGTGKRKAEEAGEPNPEDQDNPEGALSSEAKSAEEDQEFAVRLPKMKW